LTLRDKLISQSQHVAAKDYHPDCRAALIQIVALQVKRGALLSAAAECDFLIALTPYDAKTHHIIDAKIFEAMPAHSYLVNLSRGGCVDETALLGALKNGDIAGAGLDVFAKEPLPENDPLWAAPNILITPHIGGMADIYKQQALPLVARNLNAFAAGGPSALSGLVKRN
jgi:phosphoglycerate dehydrogenase-like enzyme